jgi:hypothetical protein
MVRYNLVWVAMLAVGMAHAATPPQIETVRVGLPGGGNQDTSRVRVGAWVPVYIKLKAGAEGHPRGAYQLLLRASDPEDSQYTYPVLLPALAPQQDHIAVGYLRLAGENSEVGVSLQTSDGQTVQSLPRTGREGIRDTVAPSALLVLALGDRLNNLKTALDRAKPVGPPQAGDPGIAAKGVPPGPGGRPLQQPVPADERDSEGGRRFAYLEHVAYMPDQWFGYDCVDVVVLATGRDAFVKELLDDQTGRREALLEWVRRGGQVILSVARNHQDVGRLLEGKLPLLKCSLKGTQPVERLESLQTFAPGEGTLNKVDLAILQPGPGVLPMVVEEMERGERPVIVQGACGLGHVALVGFDLDLAPFTEWPEARRRAFWDKLLTEMLLRPPSNFVGAQLEPSGRQEHLAWLQRGLEEFKDIPVIHFGWVALFVLFYIVLVGPLDYFVLKKVFKRLELTWITFPLLVLGVSVGAYLIAYYTKGNEVRINKIDVVDIDLHSPQAYGTSWFTVFSPRIQRYTVGLEPGRPDWVAEPPTNNPPGPQTMLAQVMAADRFQRLGGQGLFPRPYVYAEDAAGIEDVPIPVWSTRTFTASWRAPLAGDRPPIEADINRSRLPPHLPRGKITNNLPVELQGITLFHEGAWYPLGNLGPGESRRIDNLLEGKGHRDRGAWFRDEALRPQVIVPADKGKQTRTALPEDSAHQRIKEILFFANTDHGPGQIDNSGLRLLDQSWRTRALTQVQGIHQTQNYRPELVLVARTPLVQGPAETITQDGASLTRLWLGDLPSSGRPRPAVPGTLMQESYVRVFIPIH